MLLAPEDWWSLGYLTVAFCLLLIGFAATLMHLSNRRVARSPAMTKFTTR
jgi:hypothetical protein